MGKDAGRTREPSPPRRRPPGLAEVDLFAKNPTGVGITFGVSIVAFTLAGYFLDGWLGTLPLFLLVGLAIGGIGGFIHLVESVSPGTLFKSRKPEKSRNASPEGAQENEAALHAGEDPAKQEEGRE